jgi:hypothetical protein
MDGDTTRNCAEDDPALRELLFRASHDGEWATARTDWRMLTFKRNCKHFRKVTATTIPLLRPLEEEENNNNNGAVAVAAHVDDDDDAPPSIKDLQAFDSIQYLLEEIDLKHLEAPQDVASQFLCGFYHVDIVVGQKCLVMRTVLVD